MNATRLFLILVLSCTLFHPSTASKHSSRPNRILKYHITDYRADPLTSLQIPVNIVFSSSPPTANGLNKHLTLSDQPSTSIILKYTVTIPSDFRWGRGGRLPGIRGGGPECTATTSKTSSLPGYCWHMQLGWKPNSVLSYISLLPNGNSTLSGNSLKLQRDNATSVEMHLTLNTPGMTNGEASVKINNSTLMKQTGMSFGMTNLKANTFLLEARYNDGQVPSPLRRSATAWQTLVVDGVQVLRAFKILQEIPDPLPSPQASPSTPSQPPPSQAPIPAPVSPLSPPLQTPPPPHPPAAPFAWVDLTPDQIRRTLALTSIFENANTTLQYSYCGDNKDGRGYTFGYCGFTTGTGDGLVVIKEYMKRNPADTIMAPFVSMIANLSKSQRSNTSLLVGFCQAVNSLGDDPAFRAAQDAIQKVMYFDPAMKWARNLGIKYAITKGQLYDALINHGEGPGDPFSIDYIVNATNAAMNGPPLVGVDEIAWLQAFFEAREKMLIAHIGKGAVRRVSFYRELLNSGNLDMGGPIYIDRAPKTTGGGWQIFNVYFGVFTINSNGHHGPIVQQGHKLTELL